jgi:ATP-binding protein involved in chromosome partitioning
MTTNDPFGREAVIEVLKTVNDPELYKDLVSLGMVKDVAVDGGKVSLVIELTTPACPLKDRIRDDIESALSRLVGFESVAVEFTARVSSGLPVDKKALVPTIKNIICVSAGKGGVGKTTVACNLAAALAQSGAKIGLLDADIYGPNTPILMGVSGAPKIVNDKIVPMRNYDVAIMSMGFLIDPDRPIIWRGPMLNKALTQFFKDVEWGEIDYLIIDLPPGTGDVQLSIFQLVPISGVVVVTTPQKVALADVRKGIMQWRQFDVPVLGLIENMSHFISPSDGARFDIFGTGGGKAAAEELGIPFLGEIPIDIALREGSDNGEPAVAARPDSDLARTFTQLASMLAARVSITNFERDGQTIRPAAAQPDDQGVRRPRED